MLTFFILQAESPPNFFVKQDLVRIEILNQLKMTEYRWNSSLTTTREVHGCCAVLHGRLKSMIKLVVTFHPSIVIFV